MAGHCLCGGSGYFCQLYLPVFRPAEAETHRRQHVQLLPAGDRIIRSGDVGHGPLRMDESPLRPVGLHRCASGHRNQGKTGRPGTINMPFLRISASTPCRKGKIIPLFAVNMRPNAGSPHGMPCAAPAIMKKIDGQSRHPDVAFPGNFPLSPFPGNPASLP